MYNIDTFAQLAGISRRTVRYYIQRGLLAPPDGQKRGAYYTESHLDRIKEIQKLSGRGVPLINMKEVLDGNGDAEPKKWNPPIKSHKWERVEFAKGLELHFRENLLNEQDLKSIKKFMDDLIEGKKND